MEGIGAIKANKTTTNHDAYQDCVTAPLSQEHDNDVAAQEDQPEDEEESELCAVHSAVEKVSSSLSLPVESTH